jgi:type VI secretion system secreted protein VgrG
MALTSEKRICTVHSPLGSDALILTALTGREKVSGLFEFECSFTSEDPNLDFDSIVGQSMCIETKMADGKPRYFHGVVANFAQTDSDGANVAYRARLVPWLWFLTLRKDCRVFPQDKTALEIVTSLLEEFKLTDYDTASVNAAAHDPLPFCVQYRESTFHLISRLLEHEGIHYYFRHEADRHVMVLSDSPESPECPGQPKASYKSSAGDQATAGQVSEWQFEQHLRSGRYTHTDYNFTDPSLDLSAETLTKHPVASNKVLEVYDYPGRYRALGAGKSLAQLRMEAEEAATHKIDGKSSCYGFTPGFRFDLIGHYRDSFNGAYLITAVSHHFEQGVGRNAGGSRYENSFSCLPAKIPFRPPLATAKPTVKGVQTAVVVGESGKEIDIDDYGSVFVQFHWDRLHQRNPESSCRVRVGTAWAGKDWGFFCAPRIGQEVIVEFLEGDPDRPIITGLAYNAEQMPPYQGGTQSGIKTRSTPGGGPANFNELRFEDKKGGEEIYVHAEKNMTRMVKAADAKTVGGGSSTSAGGPISHSSGADISRTADVNIVDKAGQAMNVTTGKDMALRSGGSYGLTTNLGIQLKAINFVAEMIESGAKAAADAVKKGVAKAGMSAGAGAAQQHAKGGDVGGAAMSSLQAGLATTGSQALTALAPGIEAGAKTLRAQSDEASAKFEKLSPAVEATIAKTDALKAAIAAGASPENIAAAALVAAEAIAENIKDAQKLIEGLLPAIPSITLWAMKDINAAALWSMTLETRVKNIDIHAKNKDVNVKAKRSVNVEAETKDLNVKASKTNVAITGKKKVSVTAVEDDLVIEAKGKKVFIKAAKQIFLKCGKASISMAESGNIVINGKAINIKGTEPVTVTGNPIKLN